MAFYGSLVVKNLSANAGDVRDTGPIPGWGRFPGEGSGELLHPVLLPGESHGQRSLAGYTVHGVAVSDTIKAI